MYIRFETSSGTGIFHEASRYRRSIGPGPVPLVRRSDRAELRALMDWLWERTPVPPRRVYAEPDGVRLRTWFLADAREHVRRAWRLYLLLRDNGCDVRPVTALNPGVIVFGDAVQVIVRPFAPRRLDRPRDPWRSGGRDRRTVRRWPSARSCISAVLIE